MNPIDATPEWDITMQAIYEADKKTEEYSRRRSLADTEKLTALSLSPLTALIDAAIVNAGFSLADELVDSTP